MKNTPLTLRNIQKALDKYHEVQQDNDIDTKEIILLKNKINALQEEALANNGEKKISTSSIYVPLAIMLDLILELRLFLNLYSVDSSPTGQALFFLEKTIWIKIFRNKLLGEMSQMSTRLAAYAKDLRGEKLDERWLKPNLHLFFNLLFLCLANTRLNKEKMLEKFTCFFTLFKINNNAQLLACSVQYHRDFLHLLILDLCNNQSSDYQDGIAPLLQLILKSPLLFNQEVIKILTICLEQPNNAISTVILAYVRLFNLLSGSYSEYQVDVENFKKIIILINCQVGIGFTVYDFVALINGLKKIPNPAEIKKILEQLIFYPEGSKQYACDRKLLTCALEVYHSQQFYESYAVDSIPRQHNAAFICVIARPSLLRKLSLFDNNEPFADIYYFNKLLRQYYRIKLPNSGINEFLYQISCINLDINQHVVLFKDNLEPLASISGFEQITLDYKRTLEKCALEVDFITFNHTVLFEFLLDENNPSGIQNFLLPICVHIVMEYLIYQVKSARQIVSNPIAVDDKGCTALHHVAAHGQHKTAKYLIEHLGFDIRHIDNNGRTALHYAATYGHTETVIYLIEHLGFDPMILTNGFRTLYQMSEKSKKPACISLCADTTYLQKLYNNYFISYILSALIIAGVEFFPIDILGLIAPYATPATSQEQNNAVINMQSFSIYHLKKCLLLINIPVRHFLHYLLKKEILPKVQINCN